MPNDEIFELFMFKLEALELDYTVHINVKSSIVFYLVEFDAMKIMAILYSVPHLCCGFSTHLH